MENGTRIVANSDTVTVVPQSNRVKKGSSEIHTRTKTNTRFVWIFTRLHMYSNTIRVFRCTVNDFSALIITYLTSLMVFQ